MPFLFACAAPVVSRWAGAPCVRADVPRSGCAGSPPSTAPRSCESSTDCGNPSHSDTERAAARRSTCIATYRARRSAVANRSSRSPLGAPPRKSVPGCREGSDRRPGLLRIGRTQRPAVAIRRPPRRSRVAHVKS